MYILDIVLATFIIEASEIYLQYSSTLMGSISKLFNYYKVSPFLFFISHIGYIWLLFISINFGVFNFPIVLAVILKSIDIFTKMHFFNKIFISRDINYIKESSNMLNMRIPFWVWMLGPMLYSYLVYISLS